MRVSANMYFKIYHREDYEAIQSKINELATDLPKFVIERGGIGAFITGASIIDTETGDDDIVF